MVCLKLFFAGFDRSSAGSPVVMSLAMLVGGLMGCDLPDRPPLLTDETVSRQLSKEQIAALDARARELLPQQTLREFDPGAPPAGESLWYAIKTPSVARGGVQTVGRRQVRTFDATDAETNAETESAGNEISVEQIDELWVGQNDCSIVSTVRIRETTSPDGQLIRASTERRFGPLVDRSSAVVADGKLTFAPGSPTDFPPRLVSAPQDWSNRDRGTLAYRQAIDEMNAAISGDDPSPPWQFRGARTSSRRQIRPLSAGTLSSGPTAAMPIRLVRERQTSVPLPDGTNRRLQEFTATWMNDNEPVQQRVVWLDQRTPSPTESSGSDDDSRRAVIARMLRVDGLIDVLMPGESQVLSPARPPGDAAVRVSGKEFGADSELIAFQIDCPGGSLQPAPGQRIRRVTTTRKDNSDGQPDPPPESPPESPPEDPSSEIETIDLLATPPDSPSVSNFLSYDSPPSSADTAATKLIDFGQGSLTRVIGASTASGNPNDDSIPTPDRVQNIVATARSVFTRQPLQYTYHPASELVTLGGGGPLSEAILLSALLRGNGIPTRIAMGLRGVEEVSAESSDASVDDAQKNSWRWMGFDVWVIAHWDDRWHNIDPRSENLVPSVDRIHLAICDPDPQSIDRSLERAVETMSKMKIRVVGVR